MQPYSKEFRSEVLAACDANEEARAVALRFKVSESWIWPAIEFLIHRL